MTSDDLVVAGAHAVLHPRQFAHALAEKAWEAGASKVVGGAKTQDEVFGSPFSAEQNRRAAAYVVSHRTSG